ncbi:MAG: bifunctional UDP-3-O-[3-hydroxymyristoyl] N-acetylglucosamine deacetylase/3-hydroxyacyl-ACP dehydratase [Bacteroidales bacterium]|jgi:UDP-3-O-[3-hydroxymyristoyl] N-acetylglucosamine deacetylase/3-hydroxyacyl-[acyl-carrier-protein] dehydratase|nr:bifunctional UDP-3-O-[3-hydroxymyristoyl] N-acetylglucosamine deacetylase/3-hydroxyacyl-ACP dehydratase [Bacteroidales bacterium]
MLVKQHTLQKPVSIKGKGLHTGVEVELTLRSASNNQGYKFKRIDLEDQPIISAIAENVVDTSRGTTIEENGVRVSTVEHVLAALWGMGVDNALLEINGPEMPIMDGSAQPFVELIKQAGIVELDAVRKYFEVKERIVYADKSRGVEIAIYPDDQFGIDVMIDYNSRTLGHQYAALSNVDEFEQEIAPCRTFVFLHELEPLLQHNLIKGGDLDNAIVIADKPVAQPELDRLSGLFNMPKIQVKPEGILNNLDLHFNNEPARHKLLDLIGDFALIGKPIKGRIVATRPGHAANNQMARQLRQIIRKELAKSLIPHYNPAELPLYNVEQVKNILPHRPPFLLVDKILSCKDNVIIGVKNVTMNEPFFVGHFPAQSVMPGVLIVEAMAQVGGVLVLNTVPDPENYLTFFLKVDKVKFRRMVVPGDTLIIRMELVGEIRRGIATMLAQAYVGETLVTEGELTAQIIKTTKES